MRDDDYPVSWIFMSDTVMSVVMVKKGSHRSSMLVSPNVSSIRELKPNPVIMEEWGQVRSSTILHFWLIFRLKFLA